MFCSFEKKVLVPLYYYLYPGLRLYFHSLFHKNYFYCSYNLPNIHIRIFLIINKYFGIYKFSKFYENSF